MAGAVVDLAGSIRHVRVFPRRMNSELDSIQRLIHLVEDLQEMSGLSKEKFKESVLGIPSNRPLRTAGTARPRIGWEMWTLAKC